MYYQVEKVISLQGKEITILETYFENFAVFEMEGRPMTCYDRHRDIMCVIDPEKGSVLPAPETGSNQQLDQIKATIGPVSITTEDSEYGRNIKLVGRSTVAVLRGQVSTNFEEQITKTCYHEYTAFSGRTSLFSISTSRNELIVESTIQLNLNGQKSTTTVKSGRHGHIKPVSEELFRLVEDNLQTTLT